MAEPRIADKLRDLRRTARRLNETLTRDLEPFAHARETDLFRRLPTSESKEGDANVTTSCTCLMALCSCSEFDRFYDIKAKPKDRESKRRTRVINILERLNAAPWVSSGLDEDNAFTSVLVLRTAGLLAHGHDEEQIRLLNKKWRGTNLTLEGIALRLAAEAPKAFYLQASLRQNPALGYWLVDGADRLRIDLGAAWSDLARWASMEFAHQLSLVSAHDDAIMDPVAMVMAACLAERVRAIASRPGFRDAEEVKRLLPTCSELHYGINLLFAEQEVSGIWDKFFPMFYYRDAAGGANYCFAFEFLEAVLNEFGYQILQLDEILTGFVRACGWCERKRLQYSHKGHEYRGWNSAQQLDTVQTGKPESWATAVVHMYLHRLCDVISSEVQRQVLQKYNARFLQVEDAEDNLWTGFMTPVLDFATGPTQKLKDVVEKEILEHCREVSPESFKHLLVRDRPRLAVKLAGRRSALLFGPPGTSKTTLVEAVAEQLEWPFVEITPSDFLRQGLGQIYEVANAIFEDLMDLSGVVILFDEMDALVQRRDATGGAAPLDVTRQFLTTSMLPKLAKLHSAGQAVFFMATNHRKEFDQAIIRPGRFDLLLCMGPPPWSEKRERLAKWISKTEENRDECATLIRDWVDSNDPAKQMLDLFTYGEMKELFDFLTREYAAKAGTLERFLEEEKARAFERLEHILRDWCEKMITLREGSEARTEYDQFDRKASRIQ